MASKPTEKRPRRGGVQPSRTAERRAAILEAALAVFSQEGFAATRMEDVARRAGVAKGTIYLHFADKERLFEGIVRHAMVPLLEQNLASSRPAGETMRDFLVRIGRGTAAGLQDQSRAAVLRLLISEGPRFPALTTLYFQEIVEPGLARIREIAQAAEEAGELSGDALSRFPQLMIAPVVMGAIWSILFARLQPLDVEALVERQIELLFGEA